VTLGRDYPPGATTRSAPDPLMTSAIAARAPVPGAAERLV